MIKLNNKKPCIDNSKRNWKSVLLRFLIVLFVSMALLCIGVVIMKDRLIHKNNTKTHGLLSNFIMSKFIPPGSSFPSKKNINIILMGLDQNWTEEDIMYTKGARTDTLMVANLNMEKKTVGLLSIPRDSRVFIPGYYEAKINEANSLGGPELARKTVEELLNISVDYYVVVKIDALSKVIDALGGIELYVEKDMDYDDNWGHLHIHLKEGWQMLDGKRAVEYSRFRNDEEGDLGRIRRQQHVLGAIKHKGTKINSIAEIKKLVDVARENVDTDLTTAQLLDLANIYKDINMKDIKMATIPTYGDDSTGISYQIVETDLLGGYIDEYLLGEISKITIQILNGNGETGSVQYLQEKLASLEGFKVVELNDADRYDYEISQIILHSKKISSSSTLPVEQILGKPEILYEPDDNNTVDITIILGKDYASLYSSASDRDKNL
ncbi:MAG TPA: LCP family protein [Candidatus Eremiobacteraeota bacterium]|nr:LCP family protein [Candidatus Eremiobacteraeota bacterium]